MVEAISLREFARRDGCDDKVVRRKLASGHLVALPDGKLDAALVGTGWRARAVKASAEVVSAPIADSSDLSALSAEPAPAADLAREAERIVFKEGHTFGSEAEAKRHKESFNALLKELEYEREIGLVVPIDDVVTAVASEYALVRNRLLNIASRIAPRAAVLKSAEEVKALVDTEVSLALKELSLDGSGDPDGADRAIRGKFAPPP